MIVTTLLIIMVCVFPILADAVNAPVYYQAPEYNPDKAVDTLILYYKVVSLGRWVKINNPSEAGKLPVIKQVVRSYDRNDDKLIDILHKEIHWPKRTKYFIFRNQPAFSPAHKEVRLLIDDNFDNIGDRILIDDTGMWNEAEAHNFGADGIYEIEISREEVERHGFNFENNF